MLSIKEITIVKKMYRSIDEQYLRLVFCRILNANPSCRIFFFAPESISVQHYMDPVMKEDVHGSCASFLEILIQKNQSSSVLKKNLSFLKGSEVKGQ